MLCGAGVSDKFGLIRLYPFNISTEAAVWDVVEVECERGEDTRPESWKIVKSQEAFRDQSSIVTKVGHVENSSEKHSILEACCLKSGTADPIDFLNEKRMSLAVIKPDSLVGNLGLNEAKTRLVTSADNYQDWVLTQDQFRYAPRLEWTSTQGKVHSQKIVAHEFFVGLQNFPTLPNSVWDIAQIYNPDFKKWLLLGNLNNYRTSWVVVHVHRLKFRNLNFILPFCVRPSGASADWPYLAQEGNNAKPAPPQMDLFTSTTFAMT